MLPAEVDGFSLEKCSCVGVSSFVNLTWGCEGQRTQDPTMQGRVGPKKNRVVSVVVERKTLVGK